MLGAKTKVKDFESATKKVICLRNLRRMNDLLRQIKDTNNSIIWPEFALEVVEMNKFTKSLEVAQATIDNLTDFMKEA